MDATSLRVRCACGWEFVGTEDEVVPATQEHGRRVHNMSATRDEVLAMAIADTKVETKVADDHPRRDVAPQRMTFPATLEPRRGGGVAVRVPFDPAQTWGDKDRHYVTGTIGGYSVRGTLTTVDGVVYLLLGPAWCRDPRVGAGAHVSVSLIPEGPQFGTLPADLKEALGAEPGARRFFESLATFYRNGYVDWIDGAKRPETRAKRIVEAVVALKAGRQQR